MSSNHLLISTLRCQLAALVLFGCVSLVSAQALTHDQIDSLKRAVVLVTTEDAAEKPLLQGSGFFIAPQRIVTASHVLKGAARIRVETIDGRSSFVQTVLATDEQSDLALLELGAPVPNAAILQLAAVAAAEGDAITVLSNPQGFPWKITRGLVGLTWEIGTFGERMQITASILPGSSGGPVVNQQGHVVGIADIHMVGDDDLNFAVPAQKLKALQATVHGVADSTLRR